MSWDVFQMHVVQRPMCSHCVETAYHRSTSGRQPCGGTCHPVCSSSTQQRVRPQTQWRTSEPGEWTVKKSCPVPLWSLLCGACWPSGCRGKPHACQSLPDALARSWPTESRASSLKWADTATGASWVLLPQELAAVPTGSKCSKWPFLLSL